MHGRDIALLPELLPAVRNQLHLRLLNFLGTAREFEFQASRLNTTGETLLSVTDFQIQLINRGNKDVQVAFRYVDSLLPIGDLTFIARSEWNILG